MANLVLAQVETTYEYLGHSFDNMDEVANLLNFNLKMSQDAHLYKTDVERTLKHAVEIARQFVDENHPVSPYSAYQTTHKLRNSIKYDTTTLGDGAGGRLYADATDSRGHRYAGHIEYGFTDRSGIPRGPWPFLRPAMKLAAAASKKDFSQTMANIAMFGFAEDGGRLTFGGRDAISQINNWGGIGSATRAVHQAYQDYGKGGNSWHGAANGIGYVTGVTRWNTASEREFKRGSL